MGAIESPIRESEHWYIGEDRTLRYPVTESDGSTAQTMTGWSLTWELLDRRGGTAVISKATGSGIVIGDHNGTDDRAVVTILAADSEDLEPGTYWYVLRRTNSGNAAVLAFGDAVLQRASS